LENKEKGLDLFGHDASSFYISAREFIDSFRVYHFHDTTQTSKIRKSAEIDDNYFLDEDGANLPAYLYLIQEKYPKDFKKIEMLVGMVAPYFERFNLHPDKLNEDRIKLEWKEKNSDTYFRANHLSDGTLRFIVLATLLLTPEAPEVIIIDEPELGLHPSAINILAGLIQGASVRSQIIISTQSVSLIDNFEPEDIITVDRADRQSVFKRQSSEELKEWLKDYSIGDLWNKNVIGGRP
jgi:predicted ATPase